MLHSQMVEQLEEVEKERRRKIVERINAISPRWNVDYPFDPRLQYMYPAPTITILTNIANAMAAVPRFYVQVLHLMNKMNLPAPFGMPTLQPPIPLGIKPPLPPEELVNPPEPDVLDKEEMDFSSTEESELESEGEETAKKALQAVDLTGKRPRKREKHHSRRKRLRLQIQMQAQMQAIAGIMPKSTAPVQQLSDVFEQPQQQPSKKIEIRKIGEDISKQPDMSLAVSNDSNVAEEGQTTIVGGFGKMEPERQEKPESDDEADEDWGKRDFISSRRLQRGRLSEKERSQLDVFKNYDPGEPTSRLYIKNLAKKVTEKDLHYIYGRYVDWDVELDKSMFYVQLLSGRMKGQAFITLPNDAKAAEAVKDTNGFELHGKVLVVQFARSAKPKDKTSDTASENR